MAEPHSTEQKRELRCFLLGVAALIVASGCSLGLALQPSGSGRWPVRWTGGARRA
jgi:hypothetical protein